MQHAEGRVEIKDRMKDIIIRFGLLYARIRCFFLGTECPSTTKVVNWTLSAHPKRTLESALACVPLPTVAAGHQNRCRCSLCRCTTRAIRPGDLNCTFVKTLRGPRLPSGLICASHLAEPRHFDGNGRTSTRARLKRITSGMPFPLRTINRPAPGAVPCNLWRLQRRGEHLVYRSGDGSPPARGGAARGRGGHAGPVLGRSAGRCGRD